MRIPLIDKLIGYGEPVAHAGMALGIFVSLTLVFLVPSIGLSFCLVLLPHQLIWVLPFALGGWFCTFVLARVCQSIARQFNLEIKKGHFLTLSRKIGLLSILSFYVFMIIYLFCPVDLYSTVGLIGGIFSFFCGLSFSLVAESREGKK
jgi:hypothetical protein